MVNARQAAEILVKVAPRAGEGPGGGLTEWPDFFVGSDLWPGEHDFGFGDTWKIYKKSGRVEEGFDDYFELVRKYTDEELDAFPVYNVRDLLSNTSKKAS